MIRGSYHRICHQIADAAVQAGRDPHEVTLVAVTKNVSWEQASILYDQGHRDFGENRLQEAFQKMEKAPTDCKWHLIGTLQSNKARKAVGEFALIHSVDTLSLAKKLSQCCQEANSTTSVLLQVNTSGEESKHGLTVSQWKEHVEEVFSLQSLSIEGLMTMAPLNADEVIARSCFANLRHLQEYLTRQGKKVPHLSMGMSNDFHWAIAEGATIVRIGSAIFSTT